ncbi:LysE family translocator [Micromonospora sp. GCM10011542]|uniref:LysE family translocator n=1 Tax=Micromonospora sp. GCM10011542 TaxID=3317337 RepID=UPI00361AEF7F
MERARGDRLKCRSGRGRGGRGGALIVRSQPLFETIRWAGVAYLAYLGGRAGVALGLARPVRAPGRRQCLSARGGHRRPPARLPVQHHQPEGAGLLLAVLPQFVGDSGPLSVLLVFALSHAVLGLAYLLVLVRVMSRARAMLSHRQVRRCLDGLTGVALLGFSARLATERG